MKQTRKLYFTQIVDSRFIKDKSILNTKQDTLNYLYTKISIMCNAIKSELKQLKNVECITGNIYELYWNSTSNYTDEDIQLRQDFIVSKTVNSTTWNDVYNAVNKVKSVYYKLL